MSAVGSCSTQKLTEAIAAHAPVWRYEFDDNEGPGWFDIPGYVWGAGHATKLEYLIPDRHYRGHAGGELNLAEQQLSNHMLRAWGAFVRDGAPAVVGQLTWPRFEPNGSVLSWQAGDQSQILPLTAINTFHNCAFWDAVQGVSACISPSSRPPPPWAASCSVTTRASSPVRCSSCGRHSISLP